MDCPWFTDNCHGETIIKCCRTAKLNTEHFLSQNKNQKNCVVTSSCNWETEQWLKSCKRPKLNPTGISHSLWKWRFYHEIIKARTANSWCARTYNLACHPGSWECLELVRKQPVTNQPLTHCSPRGRAAEPSSCWTFPKHKHQALNRKDLCACPHHTWPGQLSYSTDKIAKVLGTFCGGEGSTTGADHNTEAGREKWPKTLKCQVQED